MKLTKIELRLTIDELTESITNWDRMSLLHDGEPEVLKEVKLKLERELNRQQIIALRSQP